MKRVKAFHKISSAWALIAAAAIFPARAQLLADPVVIPAQPAPFEKVLDDGFTIAERECWPL
jgi:hypothetical protein